MKRSLLLLVGITLAACSVSVRTGNDRDDADAEIRLALDQMLSAWRADDLAGHVAPYADDATWTTSTGLLEGKAAIRESLERNFLRNGTDLVGDLSFGPTRIRMLGSDHAMTNGSFQLDNMPSGRTIRGQSTLVWRHRNGKWEIIHDHSS